MASSNILTSSTISFSGKTLIVHFYGPDLITLYVSSSKELISVAKPAWNSFFSKKKTNSLLEYFEPNGKDR